MNKEEYRIFKSCVAVKHMFNIAAGIGDVEKSQNIVDAIILERMIEVVKELYPNKTPHMSNLRHMGCL